MKINFLGLAMLLPLGVYAQKISSYEEQLRKYSESIDSLVITEKTLMIKEIEALEKQEMPSHILKEEKGKIAEKYEKIINQKVENERQKLDELTKERVKLSVMKPKYDTLQPQKRENSTISVSLGGVKSPEKSNGKNPKYYLKDSGMTISYSFLNLTDKGFNPFDENSKMRIGNSHTFHIFLGRKEQLGSYTSPFFIKYGLAYRSDTYMPKRPLVFSQKNEDLFLEPFAKQNLKRSKLRNNYFVLPMDIEWVVNPQYTIYKGEKFLDNRKRQFRVGLGLYTGVKLRRVVKVKYDENGDIQRDRQKLDYGVNHFLMGGKLSLSYSGFSFFIKKDFTPIFNDNAHIPAKNGIQIGVEIANIGFK